MPINIENLKNFLGSDEKFIAMLMGKFMQEIPKEAEKMKTFATESDWKNVRAVSHKMLSSTKIFGVDEMTAPLLDIEHFSEAQTNLEQIPGLISKFEIATGKVLEEMKSLIPQLEK